MKSLEAGIDLLQFSDILQTNFVVIEEKKEKTKHWVKNDSCSPVYLDKTSGLTLPM